jgi:hypothetical protein
MTDSGDTTDTTPKTQAMRAEFVRVLSERVRSISGDLKQMREMVYELARLKLLEQFTHADARESRHILRALDRAVQEVERSFAPNDAPDSPNVASQPLPVATDFPPPLPKVEAKTRRPVALFPPLPVDWLQRVANFNSSIRLVVVLLFVAIVGAVIAYWLRPGTQVAALSQRSSTPAQPQPAPLPRASETTERLPDIPKGTPQPAPPAMPLPITFGVYALSDGQLQELKMVPGKIPDRRVAISAAIATPSATTVTRGDVKFIVFRPDGGVDASGTEVRVVAKVSRAMGVDATGKAAMVNAGDSWVIRSMSFPYKVGPVEDQPRMLLLQPEQDAFTLTPGRYIVVVKGMGYDFTVAGDVTDPNQCVERINATNGAFYSPCPPPRP